MRSVSRGSEFGKSGERGQLVEEVKSSRLVKRVWTVSLESECVKSGK